MNLRDGVEEKGWGTGASVEKLEKVK